MKDATGELSMTAIAVVAIAAIGVVFTTLIWPSIRENIRRSTNCSQAFNCSEEVKDGMRTCKYCFDTECTDVRDVQCPDETPAEETP